MIPACATIIIGCKTSFDSSSFKKDFVLSWSSVNDSPLETFMFTKSSSHYLKNWNYLPVTGQIISYENETISDSLNTFYYTLGLQFQYTFYKEYFIGINPYYLMPIGEKKINTIPVYPNYYNLTLNIGKKF